jgi:predicted Zn-dependent peptidase
MSLLLALSLLGATTPTVATLRDGTALVHVRWPGATRVSVRVVVASGADDDPTERGGLARLLAASLLLGGYDDDGGAALARTLHAAEARRAVELLPDATVFALEVPPAQLGSALPALLSALTAPALPLAPLPRLNDALDAEAADVDERAAMRVALAVAFPGEHGGPSLVGASASRDRVTTDELALFFEHHYGPHTAAVVVVGDVQLEAAREAAEAGLRWPPSDLPFGSARPDDRAPNAPAEARGANERTWVAHAYALDGLTRPACAAAAAVLDVRVRDRIDVVDAMPAFAGAGCARVARRERLVEVELSRLKE